VQTSSEQPSATAPPKQQIASRQLIAAWVRAIGAPPLLVAIPDGGARDLVESAARDQGYEVLWANRGVGAYKLVLEQRPLAVVCDENLPDCAGRELLAAVRRDFFVREVPFIIIPAGEVAAAGEAAAASVLRGLAAVLTPGCALHQRLQHGGGEVSGWVEPVGLTRLLLTVDALELDATLRLECAKSKATAQVHFRGGEVAQVQVDTGAAEPSCDRLGAADLIGFEWRAFSISKTAVGGQPIADCRALVEQARADNNALLEHIYRSGTGGDGVSVDQVALDGYLQTVPPACLEPLIRTVDGDPPASMADPDSEAMLRSMLYEMRRQTVLRVDSLDAIANQDARQWSVLTARAPRPTGVPPGTEQDARAREVAAKKSQSGRRLVVVLATFAATIGLVLGGLYLADRIFGPQSSAGRLLGLLRDVVGL
jgi:CheY-like chemotaxis protein